jgi:carboxypeptidase C (cathepsin A)
MSENGPFNPSPSGKLEANPYSWNKFANVLYLESPAGVGFSYCDSSCPTFGDNLTATDNYNVLVNFF